MFMLSIYKKELNSMNFIISGKNIEVTPGLKEAIEQKLGKLERYFTPETEIIVTLSVEKGRQKIEVTIPVKGSIIRSEQTSSDMYVSIDLVNIKTNLLRKARDILLLLFRQEALKKSLSNPTTSHLMTMKSASSARKSLVLNRCSLKMPASRWNCSDIAFSFSQTQKQMK